ncbi:GrpB family protein [Macrococcus bovicus]|uniref:GrpB family protein n=1 Tax=Macrococcus bovicus TaxID=69968 RepID=UPI0025A67CC1|nr:GrpB family protein [Macrococcus bovicus]WJP97461.1 GrpB family protein [Macrococcus bovicus]
MIKNTPRSFLEYRLLFIEESKQLIEILGNAITEIHQYGSSAVDGLPFIEEINIMPVVKHYQHVEKQMAAIEALGFKCIERAPDCIMHEKKTEGPSIQIRWVEQHDSKQVESLLLFRDYLRQNESAKAQYIHFLVKNKQQAEDEIESQVNEIEYMLQLKKEAEAWRKRF